MGLTVPPITDLYNPIAAPVLGQCPPILRYAVGELYMDADGLNGYRFVKNASGGPIAAGLAVAWQFNFQSGQAIAPGFGTSWAGVALSNIPDRGYGFIQVRGIRGPVGYFEVGTTPGATIFPGCTVGATGANAVGGKRSVSVDPGPTNGGLVVGTFVPTASANAGASPRQVGVNDTGLTIQDTLPVSAPSAGFKTFRLQFE